jgi:hypothetical protein
LPIPSLWALPPQPNRPPLHNKPSRKFLVISDCHGINSSVPGLPY